MTTPAQPAPVTPPKKWPTYGAEYRHNDGSTYSFHFLAADDDDSVARLRSIRGNAELLGKLEASIPAHPGVGFFVKCYCWARNLFKQ